MADDVSRTTDILERLRPWSVHDPLELEPYGPNEQLIADAMTEIVLLRARVQSLNEALRDRHA